LLGVGVVAALVVSCAPALPAGYHVDATGGRTANSDDQVVAGIKQLADRLSRDEVLDTTLPRELTAVPVPANAIARRYERKKRVDDFCSAWAKSSPTAQTPALDKLKDLRQDAAVLYSTLHAIDPNKRYLDASIRVRRGETPKRRLPAEVKELLPSAETVAHAYYAELLFAEQLEKRGKLDAEQKHVMVQRAIDIIAGPDASAVFSTLNTFVLIHCLGGSA
jgi:hypothetical protein